MGQADLFAAIADKIEKSNIICSKISCGIFTWWSKEGSPRKVRKKKELEKSKDSQSMSENI